MEMDQESVKDLTEREKQRISSDPTLPRGKAAEHPMGRGVWPSRRRAIPAIAGAAACIGGGAVLISFFFAQQAVLSAVLCVCILALAGMTAVCFHRKHDLIYLAVVAASGLILTNLMVFLPVQTELLVAVVSTYVFALVAATAIYINTFYARKAAGKYFTAKNITRLAVFSALSIVLYLIVKFPIPAIFPAFLEMQVSDMPALLAGFMMNPVSGLIVLLIKSLIKLPMSTTMGVGEATDFLMGAALVLPASIIYHLHKSKKGALVALLSGAGCYMVVALLANRLISIPFYAYVMFDNNWEILLNMVRPIFKNVTKENFYTFYIWGAALPFNLLRIFLTCILTFLVYKGMGKAFNRMDKR